MRKIIRIVILTILTNNLTAQVPSLKWAKGIGGTGNDNAESVVVDAMGNVFTTGYFTSTTDFDPGAGIYNLTPTGGINTYISKLDSNGNFVWAKSFGGFGGIAVRPYSIVVDPLGNIYTTGIYKGQIDFDPGATTYYSSSVNNSYWNSFISKLDASGNFVWTKFLNGAADAVSYSVGVDIAGNVYATGRFQQTVDFDPGIGFYYMTSSGTFDDHTFILKLNSSGNFLWAEQLIGLPSLGNLGSSIVFDPSGNVYINVCFGGPVDFDPGTGVFTLTSTLRPNGSYSADIAILKLTSSGNFMWAKKMGGVGDECPYYNSIDGSGNIFTTGYFSATVDFDPGGGVSNLTSTGAYDIFVTKLDPLGNFVWARKIGSPFDDYGIGITNDASGNVYICGEFHDTADFDPGIGIYNLTSSGGYDLFILKLNSDGDFIWVKSIGGIGDEAASSIAIDGIGNIYTTGGFNDTVNFNSGATIYNLNSVGLRDVFIHKMGLCQSEFSTFSVTSCNSYTWNGNTYTVSGSYTNTFINIGGCDSVRTLNLNINCNSVLNLKLYLQGYYLGANSMTPTLLNEGQTSSNLITDTIIVELHSDTSPYSLIATTIVLLNTDGTVTCTFTSMAGAYYVVVKHRNTIETWSAIPVVLNTSIPSMYDFTTAVNKAFGNNMTEIQSGIWAFYSGDVNQDENIDLLDLSTLENEINSFQFGYFATDINGDGNVDLLDSPTLESSINSFIFSNHP